MVSDRKVKKTSVQPQQKLRFFHGLHGRMANLDSILN
jgi:hypothetical protein